MAGTHSLLSASKADMWSQCLGALAASIKEPDGGPTSYAAEGTAYHTISERALRERCAVESYVGEVVMADGFKFVIDEENAAFAEQYTTAIMQEAWRGEVLLEEKLDTSEILGVPDQGGTGDALILDVKNREIDSHDLKFGRGEKVFAWIDPGPGIPKWMGANRQLTLYLASAMRKYADRAKWKGGKIVIHQPRIGWKDEYYLTAEDIDAFVSYMRGRAQSAKLLYDKAAAGALLAEDLESAKTPGDKQCRWCPARKYCEARVKGSLSMFSIVEQTVKVNDGKLSDADLAESLIKLESLSALKGDLAAEALRRALAGHDLPGWKITTGRAGPRKWSDSDIVQQFVEVSDVPESVAFAPRELKSPTEMERSLKKHDKKLWAALNGNPDKDGNATTVSYIERSEPGKTLVRDHDLRAAIDVPKLEFSIVDDFADLV